MPTMLPLPTDTFGNIREVFPAVFSSLKSQENRFGLDSARHAIVVLVDGLGYHNLATRSHEAPILSSALSDAPELFATFPSSTVANITSLATGVSPSEHGMFGYRIFDRTVNAEFNLLSGMDKYSVLNYLTSDPLSETNSMSVVTLSDYIDSGFTRATMHGASHFAATSWHERFQTAAKLAMQAPGVTYVYVPELDQVAHAIGWESHTWTEKLAALDEHIGQLTKAVSNDVGILVIADHGVVDVPASEHLYLDEVIPSDELLCLGGDPRAAYLYLKDSSTAVSWHSRLTTWLESRGLVLSLEEACAAELFVEPLIHEPELLPDLLLLPGGGKALYHRGISKPSSMRMVGQHGGLSMQELALPLLRFGAYSRSDLVP